MEIVMAIFIGAWICAAGVFAYIWLKKEYKPYMTNEKRLELPKDE